MMDSTISKNKKITAKKVGMMFFPIFFWIGIWEAIYLLVGSSVIVASPFETLLKIFKLSTTSRFWIYLSTSIGNILLGFLGSIIISIALAALCSRFEAVNCLFSPMIKIIKATPVASFIILVNFWIDTELVPILIASLMVIPLIFTNLSEGFKNVDVKLLEVAKIYKFDFVKKIRLIYIPSLMPYFVSACSVGLGFAWKSGIAAEVIVQLKNTLGLAISDAKVYIETAELFALTTVIIILSILMEKAFLFLLKRLSDKILKGGAK